MTLMQKMEDRFGGKKMPSFMLILIIIQAAGTFGSVIFPQLVYYIAFLPERIFKGEVWRVVSFLLFPMNSGTSITSLIYVLFLAFIYFSISRNLEAVIGRFRVNFFLVSGILIEIVVGFAYYLMMTLIPGLSEYAMFTFYLEPSFLYAMLFVLFAIYFPDARFLLFFFIPVRGKWLVLITLVLYLVEVAYAFVNVGFGYGWILVAMIVAAILTVLLYLALSGFFRKRATKARSGSSGATKIRREKKESGNAFSGAQGARHRCAVCGRTEKTNPELEFRYCTKCVGNYEYCSDHLYSHLHKLPNITDRPEGK